MAMTPYVLLNPYRGNTHATPIWMLWKEEGEITMAYVMGVADGPLFARDPDFPARTVRLTGDDYRDFLVDASQHTLAEALSLTLLAFCDARGMLTTPAQE